MLDVGDSHAPDHPGQRPGNGGQLSQHHAPGDHVRLTRTHDGSCSTRKQKPAGEGRSSGGERQEKQAERRRQGRKTWRSWMTSYFLIIRRP
ncbi:hypothetical protein PCL1606_18290 [Pseudomonas chlororaphis]|uniref:Uncharacterized protein n=1 Tax=Pseudomonas chlororaphis TaxID=587753 RepID=A0A0D5XW39_9PSED|nr:hypothetical protein PCL1606_18290 [Pseudomonas chlororaphis]